jgi:hypothetical protein
VDKLTPYVATTTMLVFSSPVTRRAIEPQDEIAQVPTSRKSSKAAVRSARK